MCDIKKKRLDFLDPKYAAIFDLMLYVCLPCTAYFVALGQSRISLLSFQPRKAYQTPNMRIFERIFDLDSELKILLVDLGIFCKKPGSRPRSRDFVISGRILVLKVSYKFLNCLEKCNENGNKT